MALTMIEMPAEPRQRGRVHGSIMARAIRDNLQTYYERFEAAGANRAQVLREGEAWGEFIAADSPDYAEEMAGVAEGAKLSATEIAVLNARYEITYTLFSSEAQVANAALPPEQEGCSSFGLMPGATANGHTLIGQNWDWLENIRGRTFIMRVKRSSEHGVGRPDFVGFTEAGIVGCKMGVNAAGIGLCVNGLVTQRDGKNGYRKAFHVRCRDILDAWTFDKALAPVVQTDRACSTNFLLGHGAGEIINIEATPDLCAYIYPSDGIVAHANHLVKETRIASEFERIAPHTLYRGPRLERLLRQKAGRIDLKAIGEALSDHFSTPASICRHPDMTLPAPKRVITVAAITIDLTERVLYATDGQICQSPFQAFPLYGEAASVAA